MEINSRRIQSNTPSFAWQPQNKTSPLLHHYTWQLYRDMELKSWSRWRLLYGFNHGPPHRLLITGQKLIMDQNRCHRKKWRQIFATDGDRKLEYKHVVRIRREEKGTKLSAMSETRLTAGQPRNWFWISGTGNRLKNLSVLQKKFQTGSGVHLASPTPAIPKLCVVPPPKHCYFFRFICIILSNGYYAFETWIVIKRFGHNYVINGSARYSCGLGAPRDLAVDGCIILGWISRRWEVGIWTGLGWPRIETGGGRLWVR